MKIPTTPLNITPEQRENLRLLADGLEAKASEIAFDMLTFRDGVSIQEAECGTVGCIVGNAPFLGVPELEPLPDDYDWLHYSFRLFTRYEDLWHWLFSGRWANTDNTLEGAIARIRWTLTHGLPENWWAQLRRRAPLCYRETNE